MKHRMILWAVTGICIAVGWIAYAFATAPDYEIPMNPMERAIWTVAVISCPILVRGARFYWVIPINAATYAVIGLIVEGLTGLARAISTRW